MGKHSLGHPEAVLSLITIRTRQANIRPGATLVPPALLWSLCTGVPRAGKLALAPDTGWRGQNVPIPRDVPATGGRAGARHCPGPASARPTAGPGHGAGSSRRLLPKPEVLRGSKQSTEVPLMPSPALVPQFPRQTARLHPSPDDARGHLAIEFWGLKSRAKTSGDHTHSSQPSDPSHFWGSLMHPL